MPALSGSTSGARLETSLGATIPTTRAASSQHPGSVVLRGAFVAGWPDAPAAGDQRPADAALAPAAPARRRRRIARRLLLVCACTAVGLVVVPAVGPTDALAPVVPPAVVAREHALALKQAQQRPLKQAQAAKAARIRLVRQLELSGIAARRSGPPARPAAHAVPFARPAVRPSDRAVALATYVQALGTETILGGLDSSHEQLAQQVLADPRVQIYPGGRDDIAAGRVDVRILAVIEYLAQANGEVSVSCLISGHSRFVHGRPGVVSAHVYGRAVDISAVGNTPILGHQGTGSVTERTIEQILALPTSVEPAQVISLMTLGGPSFALPDHYNHIHIGY
jgi:hypothetical protein